MQVDDAAVLCKGHHKLGDGRADVTDHHAADYKDAHALHPAGSGQHKGHGRHSARKGRKDEYGRACQQAVVQKQHHHQRHRQLSPAGNAHHKGAGNGVCKKGLQQIARCRERSAQQHGHHRAGQAQLCDNAYAQRVLSASGQGCKHGLRGKRNAAPEQAHGKQHRQQQGKAAIGKNKAFAAGHKRLLR